MFLKDKYFVIGIDSVTKCDIRLNTNKYIIKKFLNIKGLSITINKKLTL